MDGRKIYSGLSEGERSVPILDLLGFLPTSVTRSKPEDVFILYSRSSGDLHETSQAMLMES